MAPEAASRNSALVATRRGSHETLGVLHIHVTSVTILEAHFGQSDSLRPEPSQNFWLFDSKKFSFHVKRPLLLISQLGALMKFFTVVKLDQHACDATKSVNINSRCRTGKTFGTRLVRVL